MEREKNAAAWVEAVQSIVLKILGLVFLLFVTFKLLKDHFVQENWPHPDVSALVITGCVFCFALLLLRLGQPKRPSRSH